MKTKLTILSLNALWAVLSFFALILLAHRAGSSHATSVLYQIMPFIALLGGLSGASGARNQLVHDRLSRDPTAGRQVVRESFTAIALLRLVIGAFLIFSPISLLRLVTGFGADTLGQDEALICRLVGVDFALQSLLDVAVFTGMTRGWLVTQSILALSIATGKVLGIAFYPNAVEGWVYGMIAGQLFGSAVILALLFRRTDAGYMTPYFSLKGIVRGFWRLVPTTILLAFPQSIIWFRNFLLAGDEPAYVARFGYLNSTVAMAGTVFGLVLVNTAGTLASDASRTESDRRRIAAEGLGDGLSWGLGVMAITWVLAPEIVATLFGHSQKLTPKDLAAMGEIIVWLVPLVASTMLYAFTVRVAMAFERRGAFITHNIIIGVLGCGAMVAANAAGSINLLALVSGVVGLAGASAFFLGARELRSELWRVARPLALGILGAVAAAGAAYGLGNVMLSQTAPASQVTDIGLVAAACGGAFALHMAVVLGLGRLGKRRYPPPI